MDAVVLDVWDGLAWTGFAQRRAAARWGSTRGTVVAAVLCEVRGDDLVQATDELRRAGVELLGEPGPTRQHFRGPDGNVYELTAGTAPAPGPRRRLVIVTESEGAFRTNRLRGALSPRHGETGGRTRGRPEQGSEAMKSCVFSGGLRAGAAMGVAACLVAGTGGAAGAVSDAVSADPVEGYVERVYQDLLARTVDDSGRATWSIAIRSGAPRVRVANGITGSDEFRSGLIHGAYQDYLGRDADPSGLTSWLAAMRGGATIQQLEAGFLASPEYVADAGADWVRAMYSDVLGRDASPREVEIWEDVLRRGAATRHGIALGILLSDEHLGTVIDTDYQELLGRGIDPTGRRGWVSAIQAGTRYEQVLGGILASNEYWTLGIPDESVPLRNDGRVGDFPANAPESDVITFLNTHLGETPVEVDDEGSCPTGRLWEYDAGLLLVVRTTDAAGQTVSPYVAGWILYGPPSTGTNRLHTAEGLRIGDPENRIPEVYPDAFEAHPDPDVRFWVSGPGDLGYGMQAVDAGQGFVVELIEGGEACDE